MILLINYYLFSYFSICFYDIKLHDIRLFIGSTFIFAVGGGRGGWYLFCYLFQNYSNIFLLGNLTLLLVITCTARIMLLRVEEMLVNPLTITQAS